MRTLDAEAIDRFGEASLLHWSELRPATQRVHSRMIVPVDDLEVDTTGANQSEDIGDPLNVMSGGTPDAEDLSLWQTAEQLVQSPHPWARGVQQPLGQLGEALSPKVVTATPDALDLWTSTLEHGTDRDSRLIPSLVLQGSNCLVRLVSIDEDSAVGELHGQTDQPLDGSVTADQFDLADLAPPQSEDRGLDQAVKQSAQVFRVDIDTDLLRTRRRPMVLREIKRDLDTSQWHQDVLETPGVRPVHQLW